jgi:hypothetical protein
MFHRGRMLVFFGIWVSRGLGLGLARWGLGKAVSGIALGTQRPQCGQVDSALSLYTLICPT